MIIGIGLLIDVVIVFFSLLRVRHKNMTHLKSKINDLERKMEILGGTKSDNEVKIKHIKKYEQQTTAINILILFFAILFFILLAIII